MREREMMAGGNRRKITLKAVFTGNIPAHPIRKMCILYKKHRHISYAWRK